MELLIMEIDQAHIGIPTSEAKEVVRATRLDPASSGNDRLKGVLNLRGTVVPVLAMRTLLGFPERDILASDQFVVLLNGSELLAVHVDRAVDIVDVPNATPGEPASNSSRSFAHETFGVVHCHSASQLAKQATLNSFSYDAPTDSDAGEPAS